MGYINHTSNIKFRLVRFYNASDVGHRGLGVFYSYGHSGSTYGEPGDNYSLSIGFEFWKWTPTLLVCWKRRRSDESAALWNAYKPKAAWVLGLY